MMWKARVDIAGKVFGYWNVESIGPTKGKWICRCVCGKVREVGGHELKNGSTKSCGCKTKELISKASIKHGLARPGSRTHMLYRWKRMVARCHSEWCDSYHNYGARGISVCNRWRFGEGGKSGVECYLDDVGDPPFPGAQIDRIDNNGNYEPSNCRWASRKQQIRNSRTATLNESDVEKIRAGLSSGERAVDLARRFGVAQNTVSSIKSGASWKPDEQAERTRRA